MDRKNIYWLSIIVFVTGCATIGAVQLEQRFGKPAPRERVVDALPAGAVDYWTEVNPVLEKRCVVCHACYDAPCQLKLGSIEGIERGASEKKVYTSTRLKSAPMTRLFADAASVEQWRGKGFFPVLNEYPDSPAANREASVIYRLLRLKRDYPLPNVKQLPESFDLSLDRKQFCTKAENFDDFAYRHRYWGMPYALPGIPGDEQDVLMRWIEQGAPYVARAPMDPAFRNTIEEWEKFLNGDSLKMQLASRYIFEHLVFAHLYFPEVDSRKFFELVRSATPPGEPIQLIATRRPFNDPGVPRVYYRIREHNETIVTKTHMPYRLDQERMQRWQTLFVDTQYDVAKLPSYDEKTASNPFLTFRDLPVHSRYEFMLDEAQFTIMGFIKGPVCRGQVALNVINDHFWVFFVNPDLKKMDVVDDFLAEQGAKLELPASTADIYRPIAHWRKYAAQQKELLTEADEFLRESFSEPGEFGLNVVWDGEGINQNAALTVFRHFDSATVEKGLLGQPPKTAWFIGYSLLERIHYLLVAGFDVYGNVGHQLITRVYMDFLRMEGEGGFLLMLPESARVRERDFWYRDVDDELKEFLTLPKFESAVEPAIDYRTDDEKIELYELLTKRLEDVLPARHTMGAIKDPRIADELDRLNELVGTPASFMPELALVRITGASVDQYVTLILNRAHLNINSMFDEQKNLAPDEDTLSVIPGFIGAYPNAFYVIEQTDLANFVDAVTRLNSEEDYATLLDRWGVRRTDPDFWRNSDTFHLAYWQQYPVTSGMLDYNRLENR